MKGSAPVLITHADLLAWRRARMVGLGKGSPAFAVFNWALREWLERHGEDRASARVAD